MTFSNQTRHWQALDAAHHIHPFSDTAALNKEGVRVITSGQGIWLTDSEVKKLKISEIKRYTAYFLKYGSFNIGRRLEQELSKVHASYLATNGVKEVSLYDLMTHETKPDSERGELDFDDD